MAGSGSPPDPNPLVSGMDPQIRIRTNIPGSATLPIAPQIRRTIEMLCCEELGVSLDV